MHHIILYNHSIEIRHYIRKSPCNEWKSADFFTFNSKTGNRNFVSNNDKLIDTGDMQVILSSINENDENQFIISNIYPNPSNGLVNIDFSEMVNQSEIEIQDITGKTIQNYSFSNANSVVINLSNHPAGIYFANILINGNLEIKKIQIR